MPINHFNQGEVMTPRIEKSVFILYCSPKCMNTTGVNKFSESQAVKLKTPQPRKG